MPMSMKEAFPLALAFVLAGCAGWRWSSRPPEGGAARRVLRDAQAEQGLHPAPGPDAPRSALEPAAPGPARVRRTILLPETPPERLAGARYYSDLGPEELDVSGYPAQQRLNYRVYADACSRCHTLARANFAPIASRAWWEFYVMSMRVRASVSTAPLTRDEVAAALDFLEHDGRARKRGDARVFEAQTEELRRRFDALVRERLERLQKDPQPRLLGE